MRPTVFKTTVLTAVGLCLGLVPISCGPDVGEEEICYIPDPELDVPIEQLPFCQWERKPDAPEGTNAWSVAACIPVGADESCNECKVEDIDALLMEEISKECCGEVEDLLRGCYWRKTTTEGEEQCCYGAYYFSACEEPRYGLDCEQGQDSAD